ncbi:MAG: integral rane sensor signal transduction histidine kinase [Clostridia bacterium]|nr:integral rane sensor signal transduction histidine kinase [Clostridia bacterium]
MKKDYLKPIGIFLFIVIITFLLCIGVNNSFFTLQSGQAFSFPEENRMYSLSNYQWDSNTKTYYFDIVLKDINQPLSLVYAVLSDDIKINGMIIAQPIKYPKISSVVLDSSMYDEEKDTLRLEFGSSISAYQDPIYITTVNGATNALFAYHRSFSFGLGITFFMALYGLSLFHSKPSEKYLIWFSVYTGTLTLWSLSSLLLDWGWNWNFVKFLSSYTYGWSVFFDIILCCKMFNIQLPARLNWLLNRKGIIMVLVILTIIDTVLPRIYSSIYFYFLFFFSIAALIYACAERRKGSYLLLAGHAVSQGVRLVMVIFPLAGIQISYLLKVMQYSKLFNLPFAFCCMFLINHLFAEKFSESEALAMRLEQNNQTLERKVYERTQALKEQHKQRNSFMMNIFHDLRTPLFILKGCTEKIKAKPQQLSQELPIIKERLDFIQHLVDDLFLMAKLEDKQVILESERVLLAELLSKVVKACHALSESKNIDLLYKIDKDCVSWGDEYRLEQAFQNLVINAIYYTKLGGTVCVELQSCDDMAFISIHDTGVGISAEDQDKIFDRYYRVSGTEKHQSTGLGLSIAQEIIHQHQGNITVKSDIGKGTVFTVKLPIIL